MKLRLERRAEIALRSLQKIEQKHIVRAFDELLASDRATLHNSPKIHLLASGFSRRKLYVHRASPKLRLVISFDAETCIIEDIVDHDRLERLVKREVQELRIPTIPATHSGLIPASRSDAIRPPSAIA